MCAIIGLGTMKIQPSGTFENVLAHSDGVTNLSATTSMLFVQVGQGAVGGPWQPLRRGSSAKTPTALKALNSTNAAIFLGQWSPKYKPPLSTY
jgi:hypothetical protein